MGIIDIVGICVYALFGIGAIIGTIIGTMMFFVGASYLSKLDDNHENAKRRKPACRHPGQVP